jgi:hypothetical protein
MYEFPLPFNAPNPIPIPLSPQLDVDDIFSEKQGRRLSYYHFHSVLRLNKPLHLQFCYSSDNILIFHFKGYLTIFMHPLCSVVSLPSFVSVWNIHTLSWILVLVYSAFKVYLAPVQI